MSNFDFTPEKSKALLEDAEQLSLALMMLFDQQLEGDTVKTVIPPLLEELNSKLQYLQMLLSLQNEFQGGMGDAPMVSALALPSC